MGSFTWKTRSFDGFFCMPEQKVQQMVLLVSQDTVTLTRLHSNVEWKDDFTVYHIGCNIVLIIVNCTDTVY